MNNLRLLNFLMAGIAAMLAVILWRFGETVYALLLTILALLCVGMLFTPRKDKRKHNKSKRS